MKKISIFYVSTLIFLGMWSGSDGCTGIRLNTKDGKAVHGRTFEYGIKVDTSVAVVPRGYSFTAVTPLGKGMEYRSKYAAVGTICFDHLLLMDGMNEKGLSIGTFYFPGYADYVTTTQNNQARSLSSIDFPNWLLTQFATLEEVKTGLLGVVIAPTVIPGWGSAPPPFHYLVYDQAGKSLVIEPIGGELRVYDNPFGAFTNSPNFDWHLTNLRNFINLTTQNAEPLKIEGVTLAPFGQGSGMVGLPGDFTPPSRFVRAAIFSYTALPPATLQEAVFQTFHILNQFDIPIGVARQRADGVIYADYTLATVVHDPINLKYYFKTYEDQALKVVDLKVFDLESKEIKKAATTGEQTYKDVSKELKS